MILVLTPENKVTNEAQKINQLFEAGLQCLHLRKPYKDYQEHCDYLNQIDFQYHNRIVVHHFHELINKYNLKGIHFTEQKRKDHIDTPGQYFKKLSMFGKTISASFHNPDDLESCYFEFDYHLLSPIFSSISKKGYKGKGFNVNYIDKNIIALGGINKTNIQEAYNLGYRGVAVLGSIWKSENTAKNFINLKSENIH